MATVSERARELAKKVYTYHMEDVNDVCELDIGNLHEWFEQALLAERRLAMEEAAKIADAEAATCCEDNQWKMPGSCSMGAIHNTANRIAKSVRAAAEKEVGTK